MLLDSGADLETRGTMHVNMERIGPEGKVTPLWRAVQERNIAVVELLLSRGANIRTLGRSRDMKRTTTSWLGSLPHTLLEEAAYLGSPSIVEKLLKYGAGVSTESKKNAMRIASMEGNKMVEEVLARWDQDSEDNKDLHGGDPTVLHSLDRYLK